MKDLAYKYALQNAIRYNGKANAGAIIGKILQEKPELKTNLEEVKKQIIEAVNKVNSLSLESQLEEIKKIAPELLEKKEEKKDLKDLKNAVNNKLVTRIPPEPSKYAHLGHALSFLINYLYAKKYNGKCYLRYEDANPEKVAKEYVDSMEYDIKKYLEIKPEKTLFVSDHMNEFYKYAAILINGSEAYVCSCRQETMRDLRHKGEDCWCRHRDYKENIKDWELMLKNKIKEGEKTLRLKIDMTSNNHTLRDPVIFRVCLKKHFRTGTKYSIWPMYDFYNVIEDNMINVNYILKSNEFGTMRTELQNHIRKLLNFSIPNEFQYGRFNVNDKISKGREIRDLIKEKKVTGWDDPRLITLKALKRRGIVKETYYELVKEVGLSKTETNLDFEVVAAINRKILDKKADRYFFLDDYKLINIKNTTKKKVSLKLHPESKEHKRKFNINGKFYILKRDIKNIKPGNINRLMDCLNFIKIGNNFEFHSWDYEDFKNAKTKGIIIHYLPDEKSLVKVEIVMDDASIKNGIGETGLKKLKVGDIVQFERMFFARLDKKSSNKLRFYYSHI